MSAINYAAKQTIHLTQIILQVTRHDELTEPHHVVLKTEQFVFHQF